MGELEALGADVGPWLAQYGYLALGVAVFVEGFGIPLPGGTLLAASALAAGNGELQPWVVAAVAWAAAAAGDNLGYAIGRLGGRAMLDRVGLSADRLARFDSLYRRYGPWLLLFGRFFDGTRQLNGLVAGSAGLGWRRFLALDLLGCGLWVGFWTVGLYQFERHAEWLHHWLVRVNPWVVGASLTALLVGLVILWRSRSR